MLTIRYQLSNRDALIAAAALLAGCDTLYSEDMQNGQVSEGQLLSLIRSCRNSPHPARPTIITPRARLTIRTDGE